MQFPSKIGSDIVCFKKIIDLIAPYSHHSLL